MTKKLNLKHEIDIFANGSNENDKQNWQKQYTTFASLEQINEKSVHNSENSNFGHIIIASYFIFTIRYLQNIKIGMHIVFAEELFSIEKIINENQDNRFLKLIAKQI